MISTVSSFGISSSSSVKPKPKRSDVGAVMEIMSMLIPASATAVRVSSIMVLYSGTLLKVTADTFSVTVIFIVSPP